jgi:GNAT superfamily N-acetyltransferase
MTASSNDEAMGLMHTWWRGDPLPPLPPIAGLTIAPTDDLPLLTDLGGVSEHQIRDRFATGHHVWIARMDGEPAGYGWVATREAAIERLGLILTLGSGERFFWDFVTLPEWRGRGIYPRILQRMIASDSEASRIWIGHDIPNVASRRGIVKAGFQFCGTLVTSPETGYRFVPSGSSVERSIAAANLLGVRFDSG